ncbi:uncharacterized protein LOC129202406 [Grus americana]|uniref:uncharacterized protein LOC129202406 n=1 Tax=Grus americana TaxID=9117 RepID=UPI002407D947|nr:uncharacterized protein LOC129202406 [Grus americana]
MYHINFNSGTELVTASPFFCARRGQIPPKAGVSAGCVSTALTQRRAAAAAAPPAQPADAPQAALRRSRAPAVGKLGGSAHTPAASLLGASLSSAGRRHAELRTRDPPSRDRASQGLQRRGGPVTRPSEGPLGLAGGQPREGAHLRPALPPLILVGKKRTSACSTSKINGHWGHLLFQYHPVMQDCLHLHNFLSRMCSARTPPSPVSPLSAQPFCCSAALCWKKRITGNPSHYWNKESMK